MGGLDCFLKTHEDSLVMDGNRSRGLQGGQVLPPENGQVHTQQTRFHEVTWKQLLQECPHVTSFSPPWSLRPTFCTLSALRSSQEEPLLYLSISDLHCPELNGLGSKHSSENRI